MEELNDLLRQISEMITKLDNLKEQSSEVREAMALQAKQEQLVKRLQERCKEATPQLVPYPVPYPVYPTWPDIPWWRSPYRITMSSGTLADHLPPSQKVIS